MLSLSDHQLSAVMLAARTIPVEARAEFLRLIAEQLKLRDVDLQGAIRRGAPW